jgi:hypothetical protein
MPSFASRLGQAARAFGRVVRGLPLPDHLFYDSYGLPGLFKPKESLDAYGNNVWLYAAVSKIAQEIARTKFRLRIAATFPAARRIRPLDSTLKVVRVVAEFVIELDFDPARDFEQAMVDRSAFLADCSDEFQWHTRLHFLK